MYVLQRAIQVRKFVLLDDVELSKAGLNRLTVPTLQGQTHITMPLSKAGSSTIIRDCRPVDLPMWVEKATKTLQNLYGKQRGWQEERGGWLEHWLRILVNPSRTLDHLASLNLQYLLSAIDCTDRPSLHTASQLVGRETHPNASDRLAQLGSELRCDRYVTGLTAAQEYMAYPPFREREIVVDVQRWEMSPYQSLHGPQTDPRISAFDLLFTHGRTKLAEVLGVR